MNSFVREQDQSDEAGVVKSMATAMMEHSLAACLAYHEAQTKVLVDKKKAELEQMIENLSKFALGLRDGSSWKQDLTEDDTLAKVLKRAEKLVSGPGQAVKSIPEKLGKAKSVSK